LQHIFNATIEVLPLRNTLHGLFVVSDNDICTDYIVPDLAQVHQQRDAREAAAVTIAEITNLA